MQVNPPARWHRHHRFCCLHTRKVRPRTTSEHTTQVQRRQGRVGLECVRQRLGTVHADAVPCTHENSVQKRQTNALCMSNVVSEELVLSASANWTTCCHAHFVFSATVNVESFPPLTTATASSADLTSIIFPVTNVHVASRDFLDQSKAPQKTSSGLVSCNLCRLCVHVRRKVY